MFSDVCDEWKDQQLYMQIGFVVAEMSLSSHRLPIDIQILNGLSPKEEHVIRILLGIKWM